MLGELWHCTPAEALRRLLDGVEVPAPVSRVGFSPAEYDGALAALAEIRTPVNRVAGNVYRLTRDSYGGQAPEPAELAEIRDELKAARKAIAGVAEVLAAWSPW